MRYISGALLCALALIMLCAAAPAQAVQYSAWLQCAGSYSGLTMVESPLCTLVSTVDFGQTFLRINSITINWTGDITAGWWGYPGYNVVPWPGRFGAFLLDETGSIRSSAYTDYLGYSTYPGPETFDVASPFFLETSRVAAPNQVTPPSWDDLLDGRADFGFVLEMSQYDPMETPRSTGNLTSALLVIDAEPAPEPVCALPALIALAGFARLRLRKTN